MSNYNVVINNDTIYEIADWNFSFFNKNSSLSLLTDDFAKVKQDFTKIDEIEIRQNDDVIATFNVFDTFSNITYVGKEYVKSKDTFLDVIKITLTKTNIVEQVKSLDKKINPVIDIEAMTVEEYKKYIWNNISEACQQDIYAGETITISTGDKLFTFNNEDQQNLTAAMAVIMQSEDITTFPYHASGEECTLFSVSDIATIYFTLQARLTKLTTYGNMINMYIKSLSTKEELEKIKYGMELPEEYNTKMEEIISASSQIVSGLVKKFNPLLSE